LVETKPPVTVGEVVRTVITGYGHNGEGVGRIGGFTVFVAGALRGEEVEARVSEVHLSFARAETVRVVTPSPERILPLCSIYERCGGCQLLHLSYEAQLELKQQRVLDALSRLGGLHDIPVRDTIGMDPPWHYRNKVQYPLAKAGQEIVLGCYEPRTHQVVPTRECLIQQEINNRLMQAVRDLAQEWDLSVYDEATGHGLLRHVLIKNAAKTGQAMVVLVTNGRDFPNGHEFGAALAARVPEMTSLVQNVNVLKTNVILGPQTKVLWGEEAIVDEVGGLRFRISATSFFQVNPLQTGTLYGQVAAYAGLTGRETVVDVYCGVGSLTLLLARKARKIYGVEVVEDAIEDAVKNAELNGVSNVEFVAGGAEKVLPKLAAIGIGFDLAVLDPPRSGCGQKVLQTLAKVGVDRIVYVSCNPSTLARDLKLLREHGYETKEVQPIDMFPHTFHVECVALVEKIPPLNG